MLRRVAVGLGRYVTCHEAGLDGSEDREGRCEQREEVQGAGEDEGNLEDKGEERVVLAVQVDESAVLHM